MPTYEYACSSCNVEFEELQKISDPPLDTCPKCGAKSVSRLISGGNFILKGGGWYADLYSSTGGKSGGSSGSSGSATSSAPKTESAPAPAAAPATSSPAEKK